MPTRFGDLALVLSRQKQGRWDVWLFGQRVRPAPAAPRCGRQSCRR